MYKPTIGLEIHVELKTKTKMFCGCLNNPDELQPNKNICPICLGHPGTLPTINKEAVEKVLKLGIALGGKLAENGSKFDRKNYFYPDLPKGYQISQYDQPLVSGGSLNGVKLRRIHLEEDVARLVHSDQLSDYPKDKPRASLIDFNRSGLPLMELVTEPDIENGKKAVSFAKEFQLILRYLDISDADMEKGHMRIEVNVSLSDKRPVSPKLPLRSRDSEASQQGEQATSDKELGIKVEVKNINSFKAVESVIDYEIKRQEEILNKGEKVKQETRGWDEKKKTTVSQRIKEEAHDYRYFPEPDLPILLLKPNPEEKQASYGVNSSEAETAQNGASRLFERSEKGGGAAVFNLEQLKMEIPELPQQKRERFAKEYRLSKDQIEILISDPEFAEYFEESASELKTFGRNSDIDIDNQLLYNYLTSDLRGLIKGKNLDIKDLKIIPEHFAHLVFLISSGKLTSRMAKEILGEMLKGADPETIIKEKSFHEAVGDKLLDETIELILKENQKAVEDYKKGQENSLQFLIGQAMKKLKGRADPEVLKSLFKNKLKL